MGMGRAIPSLALHDAGTASCLSFTAIPQLADRCARACVRGQGAFHIWRFLLSGPINANLIAQAVWKNSFFDITDPAKRQVFPSCGA